MKTDFQSTKQWGWLLGLGCWLLSALALHAQAPTPIVQKYDEDAGLSQAHATQVLQDADGFLWFATWNGLNRFDGYEFRRMTLQAGDGCSMPTDRLRDIWLSDEGNIYCKADDDIYLFNTRTYRFSDITDAKELEHARQLQKNLQGRGQLHEGNICFTDRQGLQWKLSRDAVYCSRQVEQPATLLPQRQPAEVGCLARDRQGRIWVSTKADATVRLFDEKLNLLGYLTQDGRISPAYATWDAPVYSFCQTADGTIWLGSKPGGLLRLRPQGAGFSVEHIDGLANPNVYDIKEDRQGRLWIATLGGGISCVEQPAADRPQIQNHVGNYPHDVAQRVRFIHITRDNVLLATTTEGLMAARLEKDAARMHFRRHSREPNRQTSLSCSATMDVLEDTDGHIFVSTESGGVQQILSDNLLSDTLSFRRCHMTGGWPTDVALSLTRCGEWMLIVSNNLLTEYDQRLQKGSAFDAWFFSHPYRFNEVHPLPLGNGIWLLSTTEGVLRVDQRNMKPNAYVPNIVLTGIAIQNGSNDMAVNNLDTLTLSPRERNLTIHFAALDFTNANRIKYAFRLGSDSTAWNTIGHNHSVTLLDLKPGSYELWIRSTNTDGVWVDNLRRLVIIARPTFWETPWAALLFVLMALAITGAIVHTVLYIKRIKHQRQETLEAYLALLEKARTEPQAAPAATAATEQAKEAEDPFMQRIIQFVEQNLGNADAGIGDMAEAAAVSRSGLQRKMKQLMGVTPLDFLREARIKHACHLLTTTNDSIAEVAYKCGFSDPKYFSRTFKQTTGKSPTEYKAG